MSGESRQEKMSDSDKSKPKPKEKTAAEKKPKSKTDGEDDTAEDESEGEESGKSKDQKEASDKKLADKVKTYKVKNGEDEIDVRADSKFQVKVNGKVEEVDLQTALNEYSGKTDWTRKYQALDTERKTFEGERGELQGAIDTLHELAITQSKPTEAIAFLADMLGGDGLKVVEQMQTQMFKAFEELSKLTPEQRQLRQAQEKAATLEARDQSQKAERTKAAESQAVAKRISDVKTKHNITDDRFKDIYNTLKTHVPAEELTPELVGDVHQRWLQMDDVDKIVSELQPEGDLGQVKIALLEEWRRDPSLTASQMRTVCEQVFGGKKPGSRLKQKIERSAGTGHKPPARREANSNEPLTFDDL